MGAQEPQIAEGHLRQPTFAHADGVTTLAFIAFGEPKPKARPRITVRGGHAHAYTPDSTLTWEQSVGWQCKQALAWIETNHPGVLQTPWEGRVLVSMRFNVRRPTSTPKKVKFPMKGADVDNLAKSVLDGCQNVGLMKDDKQVTDMFAVKRFEDEGHPQGVEVEFTHFAD